MADAGPRLAVDIGGTFTDVALDAPTGLVTGKVLTDYAEPERAILTAILSAADQAGIAPGDIGQVIHGTTLVTNALIERRGARMAFVTTEGFRDVIFAEADKHPEFRDEVRMWHDHWIEMASPEIPHSTKLLREIRAKGMPVYALTNFGVESFAYAQTVYPVLTEFDQAFVSGELRMVKPDAEIYAALEGATGVVPDRLLFTDDRPDNIAAAQARGWHAHLFEHPQGWADTLVAHGVLTAEEARA